MLAATRGIVRQGTRGRLLKRRSGSFRRLYKVNDRRQVTADHWSLQARPRHATLRCFASARSTNERFQITIAPSKSRGYPYKYRGHRPQMPKCNLAGTRRAADARLIAYRRLTTVWH
jgi:hypothetical protein